MYLLHLGVLDFIIEHMTSIKSYRSSNKKRVDLGMFDQELNV